MPFRHFVHALVLCLAVLFAPLTQATTYTFATAAAAPNCSNGNWSKSGTTWTCNGGFSLAPGDIILPGTSMTLLAKAGITLNGNNSIGSSTVTVNLTATYGAITISGTSTVYGTVGADSGNITIANTTITGNVGTSSGDVTLTSATLNGNVTTGSGGNIILTNSTVNGTIAGGGLLTTSGGAVTGNVSSQNGVSATNGTVFGGNVAASNGAITLYGGTVTGGLASGCCTITATNVNIGGGVSTTVISSSHNTIIITGGSVSGAISSSGGLGVILTSTTMSGGSITTTNVPVTITGSTIGSGTPVTVSSNNLVTITDSTVYGSVSSTGWTGSLVITQTSTVYGECANAGTSSITDPSDPRYVRCTTASGTSVARFNACHNYASGNCPTGASPNDSRLYTRIAGTAFTTDLVALKSDGSVDTGFTGKVTYSIIARKTTGGAVANNCFTPDETPVTTLSGNFSAGRLSVSVTVAKAYPDVRFQIVCDSTHCSPAGISACSTDNFAIRPAGFSSIGGSYTPATPANASAQSLVTADPTNGASTTATPTAPAGENLQLSASAGAGYNGTPKVDATKVQAHASAIRAGNLNATFTAASDASGTATTSAARYDEAGYFSLKSNGIYDDGFTYVDQQKGDCTAGSFSNSLSNGKYGCNFGNTGDTVYFGRFVPHHFSTSLTPGCAAGSFTYSGQPFTLTVTAQSKTQSDGSSSTTQNYHGTAPIFAKAVTLSAWLADGATAATNGSLGTTSLAASAFSSGVASLSNTYTFANKLTEPTTLRYRGVDSESISSASGSESTSPVRSGQLRLSNAFGSEKSPLAIPVQAQYWSGKTWVINNSDSCTTLPISAVFRSNTLASATSVSAAGTLANGVGSIVLTAPTGGATGSVDVALNLGNAGNDLSCLSSHGGSPASLAWLRSRYGSNAVCAEDPPAYTHDPSARATFGVFAPATRKTVHTREIF